MKVGPFGFPDSALHTADHFVAVAEWSEPPIAVRYDIHDRYRLWLLLLKSRDPIVQSLSLRLVLVGERALQRAGVDV